MHFNKEIEECLSALHSAGLIYYPTETGWCIGCDATNETAVEMLYKRFRCLPGVPVILASEREILKYTANPDLALFDHLQSLTSSVSVFYPHGLGVAPRILTSDGGIIIRLVNDEFCRHLVKRFKKPITAFVLHSLNEARESNIKIINNVEYVVQMKCGMQDPRSNLPVMQWINGSLVTRNSEGIR